MGWFHRGVQALLLRKASHLLNFGHEEWQDGSYTWTKEELFKLVKFFTYKVDPKDPKSEERALFRLTLDENGDPVGITMLTSNKVLVMVPRGVGKTTTVNGANVYKIIYKERRFILYVSEALPHAETQLGSIKSTLEYNERLRMVFGNLVPVRGEAKWGANFIETNTGIKVVARGRGGQVRGINVDSDRPDDIVFDDLEDKESVSTEEQRKKVRDWYKTELEQVLPQMGQEKGRITGLGTLLSPEALLMKLAEDPDFLFIRFGATGPDGEALAPHYMSKEELAKKREGFARLGQLPNFYMEYESTVRYDDDSRIFKIENIKFQILERVQFVHVAEAMDPAISDKKQASSAVIAITGMTERGHHHVLDIWGKKGASPRELIDQYFNLHFKWEATKHGIEAIQFQAALVHLIREEMFRRGKTWGNRAYFEVTPITHGAIDKIVRIKGVLQPRYAAGYVSHQHHFPELETQLMDFPNGPKDYPDAVAMAVTLLDPAAALAFETEIGPDGTIIDTLARDQYEPLEDILGGDWRQAV